MTILDRIITEFAEPAGLTNPDFSIQQCLKLTEELGEIASCLNKANQHDKLASEIGDMYVALTILAYQKSIDPTEAIDQTLEKITPRLNTGILRNGTFIKEEDL